MFDRQVAVCPGGKGLYMSGWISGWLNQSYTKLIFMGIIVCVGVAGGVYLGHGLVGIKGESTSDLEKQSSPSESICLLHPGMLMPEIRLTSHEGRLVTATQLQGGKPTLYLFTAAGCSACSRLIDRWNERMAPQLSPAVQVVACLELGTSETIQALSKIAPQMKFVYYDRIALRDKYNVRLYLTLVGASGDSQIVFVQGGVTSGVVSGLPDNFLAKGSESGEGR
jgi:hypothetical protein